MILPVRADGQSIKSPIPSSWSSPTADLESTLQTGIGLADLTGWRAIRIQTTAHVALPSMAGEDRSLAIGWVEVDGDRMLARLTTSEYLLISRGPDVDPGGQLEIESGMELVTISDKSHGLVPMLLAGVRARSVLSQICSLDFSDRAFPDLRTAQTSLAGVRATILRCDWHGHLSYVLLVGRSTGRYLWNQVSQAGAETGLSIIEASGYPDGPIEIS